MGPTKLQDNKFLLGVSSNHSMPEPALSSLHISPAQRLGAEAGGLLGAVKGGVGGLLDQHQPCLFLLQISTMASVRSSHWSPFTSPTSLSSLCSLGSSTCRLLLPSPPFPPPHPQIPQLSHNSHLKMHFKLSVPGRLIAPTPCPLERGQHSHSAFTGNTHTVCMPEEAFLALPPNVHLVARKLRAELWGSHLRAAKA